MEFRSCGGEISEVRECISSLECWGGSRGESAPQPEETGKESSCVGQAILESGKGGKKREKCSPAAQTGNKCQIEAKEQENKRREEEQKAR